MSTHPSLSKQSEQSIMEVKFYSRKFHINYMSSIMLQLRLAIQEKVFIAYISIMIWNHLCC